ncbi:MAG: alpha/beta hydrolase [Clostridia bacterium]|nr:alpha/beta hydrolase [Clostridia bacterium]
MKKNIIRILVAALIAAVVIIGCAAYVNDYYPATEEAIVLPDGVSIFENGSYTICESEGATKGLILYPGGKVDHEAYKTLGIAIAERGVSVVICEMPLRLAVLDVNAAEGVFDLLPEVTEWYIGGHSLGGSMAASYMANHPEIRGLILLGSYSTADVSDRPTLSIYGSEDGVMNREKYEKYKSNLGEGLTEIVIEGGCHAYFGTYGMQKGDGTPNISVYEQITITSDHIIDFIN